LCLPESTRPPIPQAPTFYEGVNLVGGEADGESTERHEGREGAVLGGATGGVEAQRLEQAEVLQQKRLAHEYVFKVDETFEWARCGFNAVRGACACGADAPCAVGTHSGGAGRRSISGRARRGFSSGDFAEYNRRSGGAVMLGPDKIQVYLAIGAVDMRKSIDGLSVLVSQGMALDPFAGHMFAFSNRRRTTVKVLYWDRNGFCLWQKRLERQCFRWPESREEVMKIGHREFRWLLEGLEIQQTKAHASLSYTAVY